MTPEARSAILFGRWAKGIEAETLAFLLRIGSKLSFARRTAINTWIASYKSAGVWTKCDAAWMPATLDSAIGMLNVISPNYNLSMVGGVTFTPDRGFAGNGVDSSMPASGMTTNILTNAQQDSTHLSVYVLGGTDAAATRVALGLTGTSGTFAIRPRDNTGLLGGPVNSSTVSFFGSAQSTILGNSLITRTGATALAGYRDGVVTGTDNDASTGRSTSQVALLRGGSVFSDYLVGLASVGSGLNGTEVAAKHAADLAYLQAIGAA